MNMTPREALEAVRRIAEARGKVAPQGATFEASCGYVGYKFPQGGQGSVFEGLANHITIKHADADNNCHFAAEAMNTDWQAVLACLEGLVGESEALKAKVHSP